jgi:hypothetical protein
MAIDYDISKPEESANKIFADLKNLPSPIKEYLNMRLIESPLAPFKAHKPSTDYNELEDLQRFMG